MSKTAQYHDVMLKPHASVGGWRRPKGRYYPTGTKELHDGRVEVTFYLPPSVLRQWQKAITGGKRIRLFVPER